MEEIEVPLEKVTEDLNEAVHGEGGGGHDGHGPGWVIYGALLSAIFAVFAAVASLLSGHHANEAVIDQIRASDQWNYYQAKGIKAAILDSRHELLKSLGKEPREETQKKLDEYKEQQKEIQEKAKEKEDASVEHFAIHQTLSKAVTFFQIAIAVTAIAVLVRRKWFLYVSGAFGLCGLFFLILGLTQH